jgi:hypothetical protein
VQEGVRSLDNPAEHGWLPHSRAWVGAGVFPRRSLPGGASITHRSPFALPGDGLHSLIPTPTLVRLAELSNGRKAKKCRFFRDI